MWGGEDGFDDTYPFALGVFNGNHDGLVLLGTAAELLGFADVVARVIRARLSELGATQS